MRDKLSAFLDQQNSENDDIAFFPLSLSSYLESIEWSIVEGPCTAETLSDVF